MKEKIWMALAGLAVLGGLFFLGVCFNYLLLYFAEPGNRSRHEYLEGVAIAIMLSIPFWVMASVAMVRLRGAIPRVIYVIVNTITGVVWCIFLLANIYPLIMVALSM
jgi:hypothetical protein